MTLRLQAASTYLNSGGRSLQEDFVLLDQERGIFAVADGFGGGAGGPEAARSACESVREYLHKEAGDGEATMPFVIRRYLTLAGNVLFNALVHANRRVLHGNRRKSVHEKGGASCLAGYLDGDLLAIANVGCCSAWLFRGGRSASLVLPRSYGRLRDPFSPDPEAAHAVPLTALGISEDLEPEITEYRVRPGDWLVLHTDGLSGSVRDLLGALQAEGRPPSESAHEVSEVLKACPMAENTGVVILIF